MASREVVQSTQDLPLREDDTIFAIIPSGRSSAATVIIVRILIGIMMGDNYAVKSSLFIGIHLLSSPQ